MADIIVRDKSGKVIRRIDTSTGKRYTASGKEIKTTAREEFERAKAKAIRGGKTLAETKAALEAREGRREIKVDPRTGKPIERVVRTATIQQQATMGPLPPPPQVREKQTVEYVEEKRKPTKEVFKGPEKIAEVAKDYVKLPLDIVGRAAATFPTGREVSETGRKLIKPLSERTEAIVERLGLTPGRRVEVTAERELWSGETRETSRVYEPTILQKFGFIQTEQQKRRTEELIEFGKAVPRSIIEIPKTSAELGIGIGALSADIIKEPTKYTDVYIKAGVIAAGRSIKEGIQRQPGAFIGSMVGYGIAERALLLPSKIAASARVTARTSTHFIDTGVTKPHIPTIPKKHYKVSTTRGAVGIEKYGKITYKKPMPMKDGTILPPGTYEKYIVKAKYFTKRGKVKVVSDVQADVIAKKTGELYTHHVKGVSVTSTYKPAGHKVTLKAVDKPPKHLALPDPARKIKMDKPRADIPTEDFMLKVIKSERKYAFDRAVTKIDDVGITKFVKKDIVSLVEKKPGKIGLITHKKGDIYTISKTKTKPFEFQEPARGLGKKIYEDPTFKTYLTVGRDPTGAKVKSLVFFKKSKEVISDKIAGTTFKKTKLKTEVDTEVIKKVLAATEKEHVAIAHRIPIIEPSKAPKTISGLTITPTIKTKIALKVSPALALKPGVAPKEAQALEYRAAQDIRPRLKTIVKPGVARKIGFDEAIPTALKYDQPIKQIYRRGQTQEIKPSMAPDYDFKPPGAAIGIITPPPVITPRPTVEPMIRPLEPTPTPSHLFLPRKAGVGLRPRVKTPIGRGFAVHFFKRGVWEVSRQSAFMTETAAMRFGGIASLKTRSITGFKIKENIQGFNILKKQTLPKWQEIKGRFRETDVGFFEKRKKKRKGMFDL